MKTKARRARQSGARVKSRQGSRYGVNGNGIRPSSLVFVVIAGLIIGTELFATADLRRNNDLRANGQTTVGTPTGHFQSKTQSGRWGSPVTYFLEYAYTVRGVDYTGSGSTGYRWDDRPRTIDLTKTVVVYFDPEHPRVSTIPDTQQD